MARQKAYTISIPKPCHEDWEIMTQTEKGKFCGACQKNVVDFTKLSDKEIIKLIEQSAGRICVRVTSSQVNREMYVEKYNISFPLKAQVMASLLTLASLQPFVSHAQKQEASIIEVKDFSNNNTSENQGDSTLYIIKGKVFDASTEKPLSKINVLIEGTSERAISDENGDFEISAAIGSKLKVITVGYEGYSVVVTQEIIAESKRITLYLKQYNIAEEFKNYAEPIEVRIIGITGHICVKIIEKGKNIVENPTDAQIKFLLETNR